MGFQFLEVSKTYETRNRPITAIEGLTFSVTDGEFISIVGPSGCGKTTLLKLLAGLLTPSSGLIAFQNNGTDQNHRGALVFQDHGLFPWLTVLDNVAFGLEMKGVARKERMEKASAFINRLDLAAFGHHYPHELSVGMRQRVGIARAFVARSQMLLMDEPFGSLDAQTKLILQEELLRLWCEDKKLVVYITHDIEEAVLLSDRVLVMSARPGHVREDITIPLERPRILTDREQPAVFDIKWHIWKMLENDVRRSLSALG